jgi:hypothetical protein
LELTRADRNNNPTAFTTDLAKRAGLEFGTDYSLGDSLEADGHTYHTAHLLGDPISTTLRVIDKTGFYAAHCPRWDHIAIPESLWGTFSKYQRILTVKAMYWEEGGTAMGQLFADALANAADHILEEETIG